MDLREAKMSLQEDSECETGWSQQIEIEQQLCAGYSNHYTTTCEVGFTSHDVITIPVRLSNQQKENVLFLF